VSVRVLIGDDHAVVRRGLRNILLEDSEMEVVAEASNGEEAVQLASTSKPQVAILDVAMPKLNGIEAAAQILRDNPDVAVLMLSMYSDEEYVMRALSAGVKGYLLKESAEPELLKAVRTILRGKPYFSAEISEVLLEDYVKRVRDQGSQDPYYSLTDREREVLHLLAQAKTNKDVASMLNLSLYTVETHRNNLMQKLDLHSAAEIVLYAARKKLIF
jgi:DNA-binding NarL/FixJ family response regulator